MTAPQDPVAAEARLDDLRRRLYRADATEDDLRRFLEEQPLGADEPPATAEPAPRRLGRRVGLALVVVLGVALAAVWQGRHTDAPSIAGPTQTLQAQPALQAQDIGEGRLLDVDAAAVSGPSDVPVSLAGTDVVGQRFQGYGNAVVRFDPPEGTFSGGRTLVAVSSTDPSRVSWRALIMVSRTDWTSFPIVAARGDAEDRRGAHAPTTFVYPSRPPTRVAIEAPPGVGWTLVVALAGGIETGLR